jgi:hypothetical protein
MALDAWAVAYFSQEVRVFGNHFHGYTQLNYYWWFGVQMVGLPAILLIIVNIL